MHAEPKATSYMQSCKLSVSFIRCSVEEFDGAPGIKMTMEGMSRFRSSLKPLSTCAGGCHAVKDLGGLCAFAGPLLRELQPALRHCSIRHTGQRPGGSGRPCTGPPTCRAALQYVPARPPCSSTVIAVLPSDLPGMSDSIASSSRP